MGVTPPNGGVFRAIDSIERMVRDETRNRRDDIRHLHDLKADKEDIIRIEKKIDALTSAAQAEPQRRWERWVAGISLAIAAAAVLVPLIVRGPM